MADRKAEYLAALADAIDKARELADAFPTGDGWGGGCSLFPLHSEHFGYCNTSDLLFDLAHTVREAAAA